MTLIFRGIESGLRRVVGMQSRMMTSRGEGRTETGLWQKEKRPGAR
jgi:hypothetical protein